MYSFRKVVVAISIFASVAVLLLGAYYITGIQPVHHPVYVGYGDEKVTYSEYKRELQSIFGVFSKIFMLFMGLYLINYVYSLKNILKGFGRILLYLIFVILYGKTKAEKYAIKAFRI